MRGYFDDEEPEPRSRGAIPKSRWARARCWGSFLAWCWSAGCALDWGTRWGIAAPRLGPRRRGRQTAPRRRSHCRQAVDSQAFSRCASAGAAASAGASPDGGPPRAAVASPGNESSERGQSADAGSRLTRRRQPGAVAGAAAASGGNSRSRRSERRPECASGAAPAVPLMVEIAAVSHAEDADVLVGALRKRGYAVVGATRTHGWSDPCADWAVQHPRRSQPLAQKLLDDGYNAVVQP